MKKSATLGLILFLSIFTLRAQTLTVSVVSQINILCYGQCSGSATVSAAGGSAPYSYLWMPGNITTATLSNVCAGSYTCTATDAAMATATVIVTLTQPLQLVVGTLTPSPASYCDGQQVAINSGSTGGTPPYNYLAGPYNVWGYNVVANNATYTLTITDMNGCIASNTITLAPYPNTIALNPTVTNGICNQTGSIALGVTGGSGPYNYVWWPGNMTTSSVANLIAGTTYQVNVTDATGCPRDSSFYINDSCSYVYPGDANYDGIADNLDILDIGIANGGTGYIRSNPTINWTPQYCSAWGQTLASGADYRYVDCDGNGTIQPLDTNAVILNFGYTHNVRLGAPVYDESVPDLSITLDQDTLGAGWRGSLHVALGTAANPATGVYGVAFTLNFDPLMIDAGTFSMNENGTWMGIPGTNLMGVVLHEGTGTGSVQVAVTRLNHTDTSGYGDIATVGFNATGALTGSGNSQNVNFTISNVTVLSANETAQSVNQIGDSIVVTDDALLMSIDENHSGSVSVYPNPANDNIHLFITGPGEQLVTIEDVTGRVVYSQYHAAGAGTIPAGTIPAGSYVLRTTDNKGVTSTTQIAVVH